MDNIHNLQFFLEEISKIVLDDRKTQLMKESRGEKYNIFNVLRLYSEEVRLHSRFLSELLNPKGSHGLKDAFLIAFLKCIEMTDFQFETKNSTSKIEYYIGPVTDFSGGKIDILIKNDRKGIIIENKIYAPDQENQLIRYENFGRESLNDGYKLLYLTLNGKCASDKSISKNDEDKYIKISYEYHILKWLNECLIIADVYPSVKVVINQYLTLIKQLTNQNMENKARDQVIELATSNVNNLVSALIITSNIKEIKRKIVEDFSKNILEQLKQDGQELKKVEVIGTDILNIRFKYKEYYIYFGDNNDGRTYVSIKDILSSEGKSEIQKKLELNSRPPDKWNPFGYEICLNTNWNKDDTLYESMLLLDNDLVEIYKSWILRLKAEIDKF